MFSPDFNEIHIRGVFLHLKKGYGVRFSGNGVFDPILGRKQGQIGSNGVKSDFSPDINQICTRGIFLDSKKGYRIRFSGNAVFDPILALKRGQMGSNLSFHLILTKFAPEVYFGI